MRPSSHNWLVTAVIPSAVLYLELNPLRQPPPTLDYYGDPLPKVGTGENPLYRANHLESRHVLGG